MSRNPTRILKLAVLGGAFAVSGMALGQLEPWTESYRLEALGKYAEAQAQIAGFAASEPRNDLALLRTAWLAYLQGRHIEAESAYLKARQLNPRSVEALLGVMLPQMAQYRWAAAIENGRKLLAENAWDYTAHVRIMACEEAMSRWADLARHAAEVAVRYPADATVLVYWARAESALRNARKARELYGQVLERYPGHVEAIRYLKGVS